MKAMSIPKIVVTVIQLLSGLFLIAVVLLQSGKSAGLSGAIAGGMDTFMAKNKAKTWDAKLAKWTKWVAILFMVLTLVLSLMK
ncbi:preprotein translocase subunit SecG [Pseudoflavonifractor capillosus]|uniref:Protein-export membrane protein SecG n=1 Tax=Pseudoflavonifractor capillosus TaxID=106588 RepID=A0A921ML93_9FIRM|nr:preprotein translocase subunit SecG [Pseudoflavonifractor capillosus]HJG86245.1 preprotein translocase subunit SecG [Pseudoflavonifractor capillosus]